MNRKIAFTLKKEKINIFLIIFGVLLCIPFAISQIFINKYVNLLLLIPISIYLIINAPLKRNSLKVLLYSTIIMILYSSYYIIAGLGYMNNLIIQLVYSVFMLSIYLYISSGTHIETATKLFVKIILLISIISIFASLGSNSGIIPFPKRNLGGYDIGFNYILGGISYGRIFDRPQFYFAEPSYLGFFLGFGLLFIKQLDWIKKKKIKLVIVFVSGILSFSFTFYAAIIIGIIAEIVYFAIKSFFKPTTISKIYFVTFIVISTVYITQLDKIANSSVSNLALSFNSRQERIGISLSAIKNMSFTEFIVGKGSGFIVSDKTREIAESDPYIRTLVENGLIILIIYLLIIYIFLKNSPSLLLYTLVALHSVVILETPFFILIILLASSKENLSETSKIKLQNSDTKPNN